MDSERKQTGSVSVANSPARRLGHPRESRIDEKRDRRGTHVCGARPALRLGTVAGEHRKTTRLAVNISLTWSTAKDKARHENVMNRLFIGLIPFSSPTQAIQTHAKAESRIERRTPKRMYLKSRSCLALDPHAHARIEVANESQVVMPHR